MNQTRFIEIICQSALNALKRKIPYGWDLNIYRGCEHGCKYCYAIYSHNNMNDEGRYFDHIYVKKNVIDVLEEELKSKNWKREIINIGGVTDSYQPAEAVYKLMPDILKLLIKYKTPAIISTKSDLILRDYDLIDELSRITYINIAATITTMDENVRKRLEPNGCESIKRFDMLKAFRKTNASVGLHVMPIVPFLTDGYANIDSLFHHAKQSEVHYVMCGTLYLRGKTRNVFFDFVKDEFPHQYDNFVALYKTGGAPKEYKDGLYEMVTKLREHYGLSNSYSTQIKEKLPK
jgi:DNA repair photolyase